MDRQLRLVTLACMLACGCSSRGPITSKRDVLEPKLETFRAARKSATAFKDSTYTAPAEAPVISSKAPYDDSNTLVIGDMEIDAFDTRADCTAFKKTGIDCNSNRFGAGNDCAAEVASVLKFDHFRDDDGPHARASVGQCVEWLQKVKYVVVVHIDSESFYGSTAATYAKGSAVLVELASKKALGKVTFDERSHEELGGDTYTPSGQKAAFVTKDATSSDSLIRSALAEKLVKNFPSAKVDGWIH